MNNYVTEAINLKSYNLNEADKIIVMYSKENGLIKGVAKGIKKPKSKLGARMDLLVANSLQLLKGRSMDTILQAQTVNAFILYFRSGYELRRRLRICVRRNL